MNPFFQPQVVYVQYQNSQSIYNLQQFPQKINYALNLTISRPETILTFPLNISLSYHHLQVGWILLHIFIEDHPTPIYYIDLYVNFHKIQGNRFIVGIYNVENNNLDLISKSEVEMKETNTEDSPFINEVFQVGVGETINNYLASIQENELQLGREEFDLNLKQMQEDINNTLSNSEEIARILYYLGAAADVIAVSTFVYQVAIKVIKDVNDKHTKNKTEFPFYYDKDFQPIPRWTSSSPQKNKIFKAIAYNQISRLIDYFDKVPKSRVAEISLATKIPEQQAVYLMKGLGFEHEPACFWHLPSINESVLNLAIEKYKIRLKRDKREYYLRGISYKLKFPNRFWILFFIFLSIYLTILTKFSPVYHIDQIIFGPLLLSELFVFLFLLILDILIFLLDLAIKWFL